MSRNRRSKFHAQPTSPEETIPEIHEEQIVSQELKEPVLGIVHQCLTLNVREEPDKDSGIVCSIQCLTEVMVDEEESTQDFYKICTASGIEGYCMKKYISVHP